MRWGVYSRDGIPGAVAFCDGLGAAGHSGDLRSAPDWGEGCVERFDAVALFGLQGKGAIIYEEYAAAGVPIILIDYGYLCRTNHIHDWKTGHWQVSPGGLNHVPPFACPSDRFDSLGLQVKAKGGDPKGYTLLCVQTPGDMSHGLSKAQLQAWCDEQAANYPNLMIRPHPLADDLDYGLPRCKADSLEAALSGACRVVTINSNVGHDALLAGVPVIGDRPAAWSELAGDTLPSIDARLAYFHRAAYGQWTWDEMRTGTPQSFLINHVLTGVGPAVNPSIARDARDVASDPEGTLCIAPGEPLRAAKPDGLDGMGADDLRALAKERGVKVHHKASAEKIRTALRDL